MEMFSNAVLGDLVSRSISFLFAYEGKQKTATVQEELQRLRRLLLRSGAIVEEAERRLVTNRAMLRQLNALRDETFRAHYVLDVVRCQVIPGGDDGKEEVNHGMFVLSRFNPAKRVRYRSSADQETGARVASDGPSSRELQQTVRSLEAMISGTREFIVFLMSCPSLLRQPYSAHLFVDKCMFGRQMEKERVIEFLLRIESPGATNLGVLPIIGKAHIGKSTLVEHVCEDERVRDHFSLILFYDHNVLKDKTLASFKDNCVVKHKRDDKDSGNRLLIVIELIEEDVDEETWNMLNTSEESMAHGSRMIITSRSEKIARLGTTRALRIKCLPTEAYWYFLKMAAFGSDDPGQHPKLASLAFEMTNLFQGSFMFANVGAVLLRNNFNTQSWSRILTRLRDYMQKNVLIGENHDDFKAKANGHPRFSWSLIKPKPDQYFMLYDVYQSRSEEDVPEVKFIDLQAGSFQPKGRYEILLWKSRIPPYYNYMCECEIRDM